MIDTCSAGDEMWRSSYVAMDLVSPAAAQVAAAGEDGDPPEQLEVDEVAERRWKAEQANKALWAFGGRVRQVQQGWKRQQDEAKRAPKRQKTAHNTPMHSSPLLLVNQLYWEQHLGPSVHRITGDNMFGINMFGSYRSICQNMLNSNAPAAADSHQQNSSSSGNRDRPIRSSGNQAVRDTPLSMGADDGCVHLQHNPQLFQLLLKQQQQERLERQQREQQQQSPDKELQDDANSAMGADSSNSGSGSSGSGSGSDHSSATPAPATPMMGMHDLHEIEAVCRQQQLMHLPANRRFVKAVRFLQAAKQQQQQQQQQ